MHLACLDPCQTKLILCMRTTVIHIFNYHKESKWYLIISRMIVNCEVYFDKVQTYRVLFLQGVELIKMEEFRFNVRSHILIKQYL